MATADRIDVDRCHLLELLPRTTTLLRHQRRSILTCLGRGRFLGGSQAVVRFRFTLESALKHRSTMETKLTEKIGAATFSSQRGASFRFSVTPVRIWLENQNTKQQWQCTVSSANDFALKGAGIPHDIVMEYLAKCLGRCQASVDTDYEVDLIPISEGRMRMDFLLKFAIADVVWKPEYQFVLQPIEVTETQILMAKLQDANENLERLHSIIPEWVVDSGDRPTPRKEAAVQTVALKGAQSWMYLCSLARFALENSGTSVDAAVEWSADVVHKSTDLVTKWWQVARETATQAGGMVRKMLMDEYAAKAN